MHTDGHRWYFRPDPIQCSPVFIQGSSSGDVVRTAQPSLTRGVTLLELIVVTAIVASLLGITAAGYVAFARGMKITGLRNRIETVVRRARNSTLREGAPAGVFMSEGTVLELRNPAGRLEGRVLLERDDRIVFEVEGRSTPQEFPRARVASISRKRLIRAVGFSTVGLWHLEKSDAERGYLGRDCRIEHGESAPGWIGGGIRLGALRKGKGRITALAAPDDAFDPYGLPNGGRIELWVKAAPEALKRDAYLVVRQGSYALRIASGGALEGGVAGAAASSAESRGRYRLPVDRWVKVALEFSPKYVRVYADDVQRAEKAGVRLDPAKKQKLVFGRGFTGVIDEIRVQRRIESDAVEIPKRFEVTGPAALFFDSRGRLDPAEHTGPVRYEVTRDGKSAGFTVTLSGMIEGD